MYVSAKSTSILVYLLNEVEAIEYDNLVVSIVFCNIKK